MNLVDEFTKYGKALLRVDDVTWAQIRDGFVKAKNQNEMVDFMDDLKVEDQPQPEYAVMKFFQRLNQKRFGDDLGDFIENRSQNVSI